MSYLRHFRPARPPVETCIVGTGSVGSSFLAQGLRVPMMRARISIDPIAPLVLATVIGKAEDALRQSMILSKSSLSIFWSNGIAGTLTTLGLILAWWLPIVGLLGLARRPADIMETCL